MHTALAESSRSDIDLARFPIRRSKPLNDLKGQVSRLAELFKLAEGPTLSYIKRRLAQGKMAVPDFDGWIAFRRYDFSASNTQRNLEFALGLLSTIRPDFINCLHGRTDPKHLRQTVTFVKWMHFLAQEQGYADILIAPAQLGWLYAGKTVKHGRADLQQRKRGVGMDAQMAVCFALTHPERFQGSNEIAINLGGSEYSMEGKGDYSYTIFLGMVGGQLRLGRGFYEDAGAGPYSGSGSIGIPEHV